MKYPDAIDKNLIGKYPVKVKSGGGYFYDKILEYRVWIRTKEKALRFHAFVTYDAAVHFSESHPDAEKPLVLVYQEEYIDEPEPNHFIHVKESRITEWLPEWLENSKGTKINIPLFLKKKRGE